jgi:urease accessory protein
MQGLVHMAKVSGNPAMKSKLAARVAASTLGAAATLPPVAAQAHTGVHMFEHGDSFLGGLVHPILGPDHLVAMVAIGLWAACLGGRAILGVPLAFVGMMIAGAVLGAAGVFLPAVDQTIAVSLVVFGLMICTLARLPVPMAAVLGGIFAVFHGHAHGAETPDLAQPLLYGAGFIASTLLLLGLGTAIGLVSRRSVPDFVVRSAGAAVALFGIVTVIGQIG